MKTRKMLSVLVIVLVAILMLIAVMSTVQAVDAASKVKVTWNANGGKIETAKIATTTVIKGAKIGKLPQTPKKTGYAFVGWYTKKSGGTKVTAKTKVNKKVTHFAHWKKNLNVAEKTLGGTWVYGVPKVVNWPYGEWTKKNFLYGTAVGLYTFKSDGTYLYKFRSFNDYSDTYIQHQGKYRVEGNKIFVSGRTEKYIDFDYPKYNYENKKLGEKTYYYKFTQMSSGAKAIFIENTLQELDSAGFKFYWEKVK